MIPIIKTQSLFQAEDGGFKVSVYFSEDMAEKFLALKRRAAETGHKLALVETYIGAGGEVKALQPSMVDEIRKNAEMILLITEPLAGSRGEESGVSTSAVRESEEGEQGGPGELL